MGKTCQTNIKHDGFLVNFGAILGFTFVVSYGVLANHVSNEPVDSSKMPDFGWKISSEDVKVSEHSPQEEKTSLKKRKHLSRRETLRIFLGAIL